jgi:hypothetical protein
VSLDDKNIRTIILTQGNFLSSKYTWSEFSFIEAIAVWKQTRNMKPSCDGIWIGNKKIIDLNFNIDNLKWGTIICLSINGCGSEPNYKIDAERILDKISNIIEKGKILIGQKIILVCFEVWYIIMKQFNL